MTETTTTSDPLAIPDFLRRGKPQAEPNIEQEDSMSDDPIHVPVRDIPLNQLVFSDDNARKTDAGDQAHAELVASIKAHGLLQSLVVNPAGDDTYAVVAGARRLKALASLQTAGEIAGDHPVPCRVVENNGEEISLAENVVRVAMHPADQVTAFKALADKGAHASTIAARFGVSERVVEKRLRLGNVAPAIMQAYRDEQIDMETVQAFTVVPDHVRQMAVWDQVNDRGYHFSAFEIKRMLTEAQVPGNSVIGKFVGVDEYEAAGGAVTRDLFADEYHSGVWLEDAALLEKLATEKLQAKADEIATEGWKWVEARSTVEWADIARHGRVQIVRAEPTADETAELDKINARIDEIGEAASADESTYTEAIAEENEALEARHNAILDAITDRNHYKPEDMKIAGCMVFLARDGFTIEAGLVRPGDMPEKEETETETTGGGTAATPPQTSTTPPRADPAKAALKDAGMTLPVALDLKAIRTALVKVALQDDFAAAFDLATFQMAAQVFARNSGFGAAGRHSCEITARETLDRPYDREKDDGFAAWSPGEAALDDTSSLKLEWLVELDTGDGGAAAWQAFQRLDAADKQALFAAATARSLHPQLSVEAYANPAFEATVERLNIDFTTYRPTAECYWERISKAKMLEIGTDLIGDAWKRDHKAAKKGDLAESMAEVFADPEAKREWLTAYGGEDIDNLIRRISAWTVPGFEPDDSE